MHPSCDTLYTYKKIKDTHIIRYYLYIFSTMSNVHMYRTVFLSGLYATYRNPRLVCWNILELNMCVEHSGERFAIHL